MEKSFLNNLQTQKPDPSFVDQLRQGLVSSASFKDRTDNSEKVIVLLILLLLGFAFFYFSRGMKQN